MTQCIFHAARHCTGGHVSWFIWIGYTTANATTYVGIGTACTWWLRSGGHACILYPTLGCSTGEQPGVQGCMRHDIVLLLDCLVFCVTGWTLQPVCLKTPELFPHDALRWRILHAGPRCGSDSGQRRAPYRRTRNVGRDGPRPVLQGWAVHSVSETGGPKHT
jgi:hypothetical protein